MGLQTPQGIRVLEMTREERKQYDRETGATAAWIRFNVWFWGAVIGLSALCIISNMAH